MRLTLSACVVFLTCAVAPANPQSHPDPAEEHYNVGKTLFEKGNWTVPSESFAKLCILNRISPKRTGTSGLRFRKKVNWMRRSKNFSEALRLAPGDAAAHYNMANAFRDKGDRDGAIKEYREAFRLVPNFPDAHNNLGLALSKLGDSEDAIKEYREALRLKPDYAHAHYNLGIVLDNQGDSEVLSKSTAKRCASCRPIQTRTTGLRLFSIIRVTMMQPSQNIVRCYVLLLTKTHFHLGRLLKDQGKDQAASEEFATACALEPLNAQVCPK